MSVDEIPEKNNRSTTAMEKLVFVLWLFGLTASVGAFAPIHTFVARHTLSLRSAPTEQEKKLNDDVTVPQDQASTTAELLSSLWDLIAQGSSMVRGVSETVATYGYAL